MSRPTRTTRKKESLLMPKAKKKAAKVAKKPVKKAKKKAKK